MFIFLLCGLVTDLKVCKSDCVLSINSELTQKECTLTFTQLQSEFRKSPFKSYQNGSNLLVFLCSWALLT